MMKRETLKIKSWNIDSCISQSVDLLETHVWRVKKELHSRFFGPFCIILEKQTDDEQFMDDFESPLLCFSYNMNDTVHSLTKRIKYYTLLPKLRPQSLLIESSELMLQIDKKRLAELQKGGA